MCVIRRGILFGLALALFSAPTGGHAAGASSKARAIIDRYVEVSGGRAAFDADTVLHLKGRVTEEGLNGTFETWMWSPDRVLNVSVRGTLRAREGFDGTSAWRTDLTSKQVTLLAGKDLEAMRGDAWFATEQWARDSSVRIVAGPHAFMRGRAFQALEVTPPTGPVKELWFDDVTGLLARITHHRDQYQWNEDLAGWKKLAGRKRWTVSTIGDSTFAASYRRQVVDSVHARLPKDPAAFSPSSSSLKPVTWLRTRGVARLPFRYRSGSVWVRASINGTAPADYILDTGCTSTAIDASYAHSIGLTLEGEMGAQGVGGFDTGGFAHVNSLRVTGKDGDGVEVRDLKVIALSLKDDLSSADWDKTSGLLGYDFLSRFVVEIDFDRQVVTLREPATFQYHGGGQAIPMTLSHNIPTVEVKLNDNCVGRFIVDVGNSTVMCVHSDQAARCHLLFAEKRKELRHWVGGIGGMFPETVCRLDSVRIGPFTWEQPVAGLTYHTWGGVGSKEINGNLGTSVLERFVCTFDYARGTLWLEPGARYAARDRFTHSGLYLVHWSGAVLVAGIVKHSPAEDAGLVVRDLIKSVNGRAIERWSQEDLERLFDAGPLGSIVKVTIERDLREQDLELTLADVL